MKTFIYFLVVLFVTHSALAAPAVEKPEDPAQKNLVHESQAIYYTDKLKLIPHSEQEENEAQYYTIDVTYPQIEGETIGAKERQFNKMVSDMTAQEQQRFKKYVTADMPHMRTLPEEVRQNSLQIDYDIDVIKPGNDTIISVRLSIEGFQAGRAHPYHSFRVLNFNLATGKEIALSDLFKSRSAYLNAMAKYSQKKLDEKLQDKWMIEQGTKPVAKSFQIWNLESDGILITFNEYQVAPYVYGPQEVTIPYKDLKALISPEAPVFACLEKSCGFQVESRLETPEMTAVPGLDITG